MNELRTNPLDSVQLSLICLIESEAKELLAQGRNPHARRVVDACDKLIRWSESTRGQLTPEQRAALDALTLEEVIARLAAAINTEDPQADSNADCAHVSSRIAPE